MNAENPERLRPHPEERFAPEQQVFDLDAATRELEDEVRSDPSRLGRKTLYQHGPVTVALFLFPQGSSLPQHVANGLVTIQVIEGRLAIEARGQRHDLPAGRLLVPDPGIEHDVHATQASRMLLTVHLATEAT
jgi:quercetin dioxygenase-like cupin family protein